MNAPKEESEEIDLTVVKKGLLLERAMTNFLRSNKQVLIRQATEMYTFSSRNAGMKLEWQGTLRVPLTALQDHVVCDRFLRKLTQTSEKDNVNRTEVKSKQAAPNHQ